LIWWPPDETLIEKYTTRLHTTQQKWIIPNLLGHYAPTLSSKYLEKGDGHLISHLQCPSFDATLHQRTIQSRIECLIWPILLGRAVQSRIECLIRPILLGFAIFNSIYFNVVESYTLFCFPTCNSCKLT
jgi:hypothetical protein